MSESENFVFGGRFKYFFIHAVSYNVEAYQPIFLIFNSKLWTQTLPLIFKFEESGKKCDRKSAPLEKSKIYGSEKITYYIASSERTFVFSWNCLNCFIIVVFTFLQVCFEPKQQKANICFCKKSDNNIFFILSFLILKWPPWRHQV